MRGIKHLINVISALGRVKQKNHEFEAAQFISRDPFSNPKVLGACLGFGFFSVVFKTGFLCITA